MTAAIDLEKACARLQHAIAVDAALDLEAACSVRQHEAMIDE